MLDWGMDLLLVDQKETGIILKISISLMLVALLWGCGVAPVQEMSDARQAIHAAKEAGAGAYLPEKIHKAQELISKAEAELEAGRYAEARHNAILAREQAQQARIGVLETRP
jgi:hypothetical protein